MGRQRIGKMMTFREIFSTAEPNSSLSPDTTQRVVNSSSALPYPNSTHYFILLCGLRGKIIIKKKERNGFKKTKKKPIMQN